MAKLYLSTRDVADKFSVEPSLVRLWCQNDLVRAEKRKNRWCIDRTALEKPHPILQRLLIDKSGYSSGETVPVAVRNEQGRSAEGKRRVIYDGWYRCPKCRQPVSRTDVDWLDGLKPPGTKSWREGGKLQCTHCGYETDLSPRLRMWLDPWYANHKRQHIRQSVREQVLERAGQKCEMCGASEDLQLHHIRPSWQGGSSEAFNLQVLCRRCHFKLEGNLPVSELTDKWLTPEQAAEMLGVKSGTVVKWCKQHTLRHSKHADGKWLISDAELQRKKSQLVPRRRP